MLEQDDLIRVFWPLDAFSPTFSGVLVGWRNSSADFFVVSLLRGAQPSSVQNALLSGVLLQGNRYPLDRIRKRCGMLPLEVIGLINPSQTLLASDDLPQLVIYTDPVSKLPYPRGGSPQASDVQFIFFRRPNPVQMQFRSLEPISLALTHESDRFGQHDPRLEELDAAENAENARVQQLMDKLRQHTVVKFAPTDKESSLRVIINQVNCCSEINALLEQNIGAIATDVQPVYSFVKHLQLSLSRTLEHTYHSFIASLLGYLYPPARKTFILIFMAVRIFAEIFLVAINSRLPTHGLALLDISATAQQIDLRLQQLCYWPIQYRALRERRQDWRSITNHHTEYIRFFNSLWLVANDIIIGMAVGSFIVQNADYIAFHLERIIEAYSTSGLRQSISWLAQDPGGLKLNSELAQFLGSLFVWIINYWAGFVHLMVPHFPKLIRLIGLASVGGATMPIAICSDVVSMLTIHIHCFYLASARIYHLQLTTLISLFHLFRGKKRNELRNRIDSCDYGLDQLLLGTVMFTLLTYLLPTVLVFYSTFAFARTVIIVLKALLDTMLAGLNHFPLFALMLRVKDSGRLPGGIRFDLKDNPHNSKAQPRTPAPVSYISLEPIPLSVRAILHEYFRLGGRIQQHYLSADVLSRVATGRFVPSIPRRHLYGLQYSMLPAQRVSIRALWTRLDWDGRRKQPDGGWPAGGKRVNGSARTAAGTTENGSLSSLGV